MMLRSVIALGMASFVMACRIWVLLLLTEKCLADQKSETVQQPSENQTHCDAEKVKFESRLALMGAKRPTITADVLSVTTKVKTTSGIVVGRTTKENHEFYEIPYAEPPVGKWRWQDPRPIAVPLPEINAVTNNYLHCYGYPGHCDEVIDGPCPFHASEDCLVLNVFVPSSVKLSADHAHLPSERLPVLFNIHGGAFKFFSGTGIRLHGAKLAKVTNTIVVTINYRLGALGFLAHKEAGQKDIKGNQALKDQRLAMQWVQDNINNFGGDKDRVTIFGNSAGAQSVSFHTVSAKSKDLYTNAIQQSNPNIYSFIYPDREVALRIANRLVKALECDKTPGQERQCLMDASPEKVMAQMPSIEKQTALAERNSAYAAEAFLPMIDGEEFTERPFESYRAGRWNKDKGMIIGITTQEMEDLQYSHTKQDKAFGEDEFKILNGVLFGENMGLLISENYKTWYPPSEGWNYKKTIGIMWSHVYFYCSSRKIARFISDTTEASIYFYADSHPVLSRPCMKQTNSKTGCAMATHGSEVQYVFRTRPQDEDFTEADQAVEDEFSTYWGSFARTGDPSNGLENSLGDFVRWPEYKRSQENGESPTPWRYMDITAPTSKVESAFHDEICDFWDSINYGILHPSHHEKANDYLILKRLAKTGLH